MKLKIVKSCKAILKAGILAGMMTGLFNCSQNLPVNPEAAPAAGQTVRSDRGEIHLLQADPAKIAAVTKQVVALQKETLDSSLFYMKIFIAGGMTRSKDLVTRK